MKKRIDDIRAQLQRLDQLQLSWRQTWKEIQDYLLPNHGFFDTKHLPNQGEKRHGAIIDGRATQYLRRCAAMMQTGLSSKARPWFRLGTHDPELAEYGPVKDYLETVERTMYQALARSNFYECVHTLMIEVVGFGTGALYMEPDARQYVRCYNFTVGEYYLALDGDGRISHFFRRYQDTAQAIASRFGKEKCSPQLQKSLEDRPFDYYKCIHAIRPRQGRDSGKRDGVNKRFESIYLEEASDDKILAESGYDAFPLMVPRWSVTGPDVYGRCPGMDALPDAKQLQDVAKGIAVGIHREIDPPMLLPAKLKNKAGALLPGAHVYEDVTSDQQARPLVNVKLNINDAQGLRENLLMALKEHFFNDLFIFLMQQEPGDRTAYEVAKRYEEKLLLLGPVIERQESELLDPTIDRLYQILDDDGRFPQPPQELAGQDIKVEYISLLAQAQQLVGTQALEKTVGFTVQLAQANPDILDKIDFDQVVDTYGSLVGVPNRIVRPDDVVAKIRAARAQEQAQAAELQSAAAGVQMAQAMSQTNTQPGNALSDMREGLAGMEPEGTA